MVRAESVKGKKRRLSNCECTEEIKKNHWKMQREPMYVSVQMKKRENYMQSG